MGMFVKVAIVKGCTIDKTKVVLGEISKLNKNEMEIDLSDIRYLEEDGDVVVHLNFGCTGYDELCECMSIKLDTAVLLLYIYDGDFWAYEFYEKGEPLDKFNPIPDYFEDMPVEQREEYNGDAKVIAQYFDVSPQEIEKYFIRWTDEISVDDKAYEKDEFGYEDWQMADFMKKIGHEYTDFEY